MRFLCRIGIHQWFMDSALFASGDRCNYCLQWRDPEQGARVDAIRERFKRESQS